MKAAAQGECPKSGANLSTACDFVNGKAGSRADLGRSGRSIHQPHAAPSSRVFRPMALISAARRLRGRKAESLDGGPSNALDDG